MSSMPVIKIRSSTISQWMNNIYRSVTNKTTFLSKNKKNKNKTNMTKFRQNMMLHGNLFRYIVKRAYYNKID